MNYPTILIKTGKHTMTKPRNCEPVLQKLFYEAGFINNEEIEVVLGPRIRAGSGTPTYALGQMTDRTSVEIKVKTDNNDSRHIFFVFPPKDTSQEKLHGCLKVAIRKLSPPGGPLKVPLMLPENIKADKEVVEKKAATVRTHKSTTKEPEPVPEQETLTSEPIITEPEPTATELEAKKSVGEVMNDHDILKILMDFISEKANGEKQISRKDALQIIDNQKLGFKANYIIASLLRKKLISVVPDNRGWYSVNYDHPTTTKEEPLKASIDTSLLTEKLNILVEQMNKHQETEQSIMNIDNEIVDLKNRIKVLGEQRETLMEELNISMKAAEKYNTLQQLLGDI